MGHFHIPNLHRACGNGLQITNHTFTKDTFFQIDMTEIEFKIEYATQWGEILCLCHKTAGSTLQQTIMHTSDGQIWECSIEVAPFALVEYHYTVARQEDMKTVRTMRQGIFKLLTGREKRIVAHDHWAANDINDVFLHTAFSKCVFKAGGGNKRQWSSNGANTLCLHTTPPTGRLLVGDCRQQQDAGRMAGRRRKASHSNWAL